MKALIAMTDASTLDAYHQEAGAVFATGGSGIRRPEHYGDAAAEYRAARESAVLIDRSHRGRIRVEGADRADWLHRISTGDVRALPAGRSTSCLFLNGRGRLVELFDLLAHPEHHLLALTGHRAAERVRWLDELIFMEDVRVADLTPATAELLLAGPQAAAVLAQLGIDDPHATRPASIRAGAPAGAALEVSAAGWLAGAAAYRIVTGAAEAAAVWAALRGAAPHLRPAGAVTEETLRIEAGIPAAGSEINERSNPLELGLRWAIAGAEKGCYTGQEVVTRLLHSGKLQRQLRVLRLEGAAPPEAGTPLHAGDEEAGTITSAAFSPGAQAVVALALLGKRFAAAGTPLTAGGRQAQVVEPAAPAGG